MNPCHPSQLLIKANNCYYLSLNSDLTITSANEKFLNLFVPQTENKSLPFLSLFSGAMRSEWQSQLEKIQSGVESAVSLTNVIKTEKESLTIDWHICAVTDNENKIGGFEMLGVLLKKTVLKSSDQNQLAVNQGSKLKLLLFKLKKILDSSQDVICVVNEKGKFTKVSAASKEVLVTNQGN
jgi:transcriptional regulator with PAS, ATPase and Fis domain